MNATLTGGNFEDEEGWMTLDQLLDRLEEERKQRMSTSWWDDEE